MTQQVNSTTGLQNYWSTLDNAGKCKYWDMLSPTERAVVRDLSGLTAQLIGLEGKRVEVENTYDNEKRRFWVGRSTGWRPCHLEIAKRTSQGGDPAEKSYKSVRVVTEGRYLGNTQR